MTKYFKILISFILKMKIKKYVTYTFRNIIQREMHQFVVSAQTHLVINYVLIQETSFGSDC